MKKRGVICLLVCFIIVSYCCLTLVFAAASVQNNTVSFGAHSIDAKYPVLGNDQLVSNIQSAVLVEANTDTLMYAWNADKKMSPASFVKIMTALIAVEHCDLSDAVTITEEVLNTVPHDAVTANLQADEVLTAKDLLYCMMVGSANDAAAVLADHISGSQTAFVAEMNRYALELGCNGTNFTNAHGLHDDDQYTTARDVAKILFAAIQNEQFCSVFEAVQYTVPATNKSDARNLITGNYLMNQNQDSVEIYYDSRVTGGRTGVSASRERCIAVTAEHGNMRLISIVMGAKSVYQDDGYTVQSFGGYKETSTLLDAGFEGYRAVQIIHQDQAMIQYPVGNGESDIILGANASAYTVLPQELPLSQLNYTYSVIPDGLSAPIEKGQLLSNVEVWYGSQCVAQVDLYAMNSVRIKQEQPIGQNDKENGILWPAVLTVIICLAVGSVVIAMVIRVAGRLSTAAARSRSRRYRRNRRRSR